jgi:spore coat polysaccharide biosynthesis protein SpsF
MRVVATIEARMTSSRLPGKVMMKASGKPMLEHLIRRLKSVSCIDDVVLATTTNSDDDVLYEFSESQCIRCFRGSEDDVMMRVLGAAEEYKTDIIVEITGDCPIIDPRIVEQCIHMYKENDCDYLSNVIVRSYPDGMDTQVFRLETLRKSEAMTSDKLDREHVSLHIRKNPYIFKHINLVASPDLYWPELGLTLDEIKDYELIRKVIEHFGDKNELFSCSDVVSLLKSKPDWVSINEDVERKGNA